MSLDENQIHALLSQVADTRSEEIGCDECLGGMAEFAEAELVGREVPDALRRIHAHLAFCPECAEEYALLRELLGATHPEAPAE